MARLTRCLVVGVAGMALLVGPAPAFADGSAGAPASPSRSRSRRPTQVTGLRLERTWTWPSSLLMPMTSRPPTPTCGPRRHEVTVLSTTSGAPTVTKLRADSAKDAQALVRALDGKPGIVAAPTKRLRSFAVTASRCLGCRPTCGRSAPQAPGAEARAPAYVSPSSTAGSTPRIRILWAGSPRRSTCCPRRLRRRRRRVTAPGSPASSPLRATTSAWRASRPEPRSCRSRRWTPWDSATRALSPAGSSRRRTRGLASSTSRWVAPTATRCWIAPVPTR